ncbi:Rib/alpha-like domain-containing protein [Corynebacterium sp. KPL1995]|uniref:Rib/alpha-like domain-containing protein n=1 Tax=Corynebacterium sp. KPL1995 TaxID=1203624 RepID=UPI0012EBED2D|nr:Rib/alpha-like domain-containing protein [Corynebacterium sp. KPL1995]
MANRQQPPKGMKDPVFVGAIPAESLRSQGKIKFDEGAPNIDTFAGWYGQPMGSIGKWYERKNVPKFNPNLADIAEDVEPQYKPVENGGTQSAQPSFVDQDDQSKTADKPNGTKFSLGNGAPEGATVNADTGVVSLAQPVDQETSVPVKVTYSDGSSDTTNVVFKPAAKKTAEQVQPKYGKPKPGGKTSEKPTFHAEGNSDEIKEKPTGTFFGKGEGAPEGVTVDSETGVVSLDNPVTAETTVPVKVEYEDGSTDHVDVVFTPAKNSAPSISGLGPKSVVEGQEIDPIKPVVENKGEGQITASGLPNGLSVNPETGEISGTPQISDWKDSFDQENPKNSKFEDSRDFEVEVTVPGEPAAKQSFTLTVQRDTDGDGQPDATDADDDGDGVADTDELEKGSNPKDKNSTPAPAPSITGDAAEGGNKLPEGTPTKVGQKVANPTEGMSGTVTIDDKPVAGAKVVVDPETGEITVTVPEGTLGDGVTEKAAKVQITDADGNNVGGPIDAKVTKEISKVVDPEWKNTNLPDDGSRVNVPNTGDEIPHDTDVDLLVGYGEHNKGEQDWTVRLEENGSITVIPGGDAAPEDSIEVHVELTYADGSKETKTFIVKVPLTFEGFFPENLGEPDYPNSGGSDRPNTPNTTHGEFGPITGEDSGDITAGDVFDQADRFDPEWNDTDTPEDGSAVTVNNTGDALPHGTTVELGWGHGTHNKGTQDWDVELEENGDITVTPGADAEHGDSVLVQAVITYADGSTETKEFIVQVPVSGEEYVPGNFGEYGPMLQSEETELTAEEAFGQAEMIEPNWADTSTPEDGSPVTVKNTGDALPHGTKVDLGWGHGTHNKGTQDWDVDLEENGDITVKPGADAKPGDSIVVEVSITYPDGTKETKSFVTQVPVTGEEFVPGNFGELPVLTGDDNDDLTAGDVFTEAPTVNDVHPGDNIITGTGKPGATITVTGPNGFSTTTKVNENGNWSIDLPGGATPEAQYIVSQKDGDKAESDQIIVTVGKGNEPLPNPGSSELPGSSLGSSNFDIPRHLQCAVFAGGVTAIPLILLSPLHNMYELVMNPHLAGLREQFNREIHAIDQQVRRSVGPEGRAALDVLDHINGRVHQFNQQLGQFAHENRHIGLAAAAIAVAGLSYQHCMNTQANQSSSATGSSVDLSSSSSEQQTESRGIVGWFQGLFNRK